MVIYYHPSEFLGGYTLVTGTDVGKTVIAAAVTAKTDSKQWKRISWTQIRETSAKTGNI